jgi:hydroxypyruvate isomerase
MFDCYHVGIEEGDVLRKLERFLTLIGHVQIATVPSRAEPDQGEFNYRAIFDNLDRLKLFGLHRLRIQTGGANRRWPWLGEDVGRST